MNWVRSSMKQIQIMKRRTEFKMKIKTFLSLLFIPLCAQAICPPFTGVYSTRLVPEGFRQLTIEYNSSTYSTYSAAQAHTVRGRWHGQLSDGRCEDRELIFKPVAGKCLALASYSEEPLFELLAIKASGSREMIRIFWRDAIYELDRLGWNETTPECKITEASWPPR